MRFTQTQIPIMKKKCSTRSTDTRHSFLNRRNPATAGRRRFGQGGFINLRVLVALFLWFLPVWHLPYSPGKDGAVRTRL